MRIIAISDVHGFQRSLKLPAGDVLVNTGDITHSGELEIMEDFRAWLKEQPFKHKLVLGGNHDFSLDKQHGRYPKVNGYEFFKDVATYMEGDSIEIDNVLFWGGPWVPNLPLWAFPEAGRVRCWDDIPAKTQVLLTHTPPEGILDDCGPHVGSLALKERIRQLPDLKVHVFGHIHEGREQGWNGCGAERGCYVHDGEPRYVLHVNASVCTRRYKPTNAPQIIDLIPGEEPRLMTRVNDQDVKVETERS